MIQGMYEDGRTTVKYAVGLIKWFNASVRKHQESVLSSFLLAIVGIRLSKRIRRELILC